VSLSGGYVVCGVKGSGPTKAYPGLFVGMTKDKEVTHWLRIVVESDLTVGDKTSARGTLLHASFTSNPWQNVMYSSWPSRPNC
jgi:hypothetical protein